MKIDVKILKKILEKDENKYIFDLYKIYVLCMKLTDSNLSKGRKLLEKKEDRVYTVNVGVLKDEDRIIFEIKRIYEAANKTNNKKERDDIIDSLRTIKESLIYNNNTYNKKEKINDVLLGIKRSISVLQAKLGLPISFFYAASTAFEDVYQIKYINELSGIYNDKKSLEEFDYAYKNGKKEYKEYNNDFYYDNIIKNKNIDNYDDIIKIKNIDKGLYK